MFWRVLLRHVLEAMLPWKRCCHVYVLEVTLACFFCFGPTWEEALCMFALHVLEAMLARLRSGSDVGMFSHISRWPTWEEAL